MDKVKRFLRLLIPVLFWLLLWEIASIFINKEILLPSPFSVGAKLAVLLCDYNFYLSVCLTLLRVVLGYFIGAVAGTVLAVISFYHKWIGAIISPLFTIIRATPVASFIILALVWLGKNFIPSFTAMLMVMPIFYGSTLTGIHSTDKKLSEVSEIYKFGKIKKLRLLYFPSALPFFLSGAKTSLGLAWKSGVAAEVLCSVKYSIGGEIYNSKLYLETTELVAWTLCVVILSLILENIISLTTFSVYRKYTVGEFSENAAEN